MRVSVLLFAAAGTALCQQPSFEVASVKTAAPQPPDRGGFLVHGGPGSSDPALASFTNIDLVSLVAMAYGIQRHQLSGPDWLSTTRFDIAARLPLQATPAEYRLMLQNLLADRFKLTLHRAQKELQVYDLEIAKGGLKLTALPEDAAAPSEGLKPPPSKSSPPLGYKGAVNVSVAKGSMARLAGILSGLLDEPVTDGTGLPGNYEIKFRALIAGHQSSDAASATSDPDIFEALQERLGLQLVRKKRMFEILVIDHIEKTPTEN